MDVVTKYLSTLVGRMQDGKEAKKELIKADAKIAGRGPPLSRQASPVRATVSEVASGHCRGKLEAGGPLMAEENAVKLKDFLERHGARLGEKIEQNLTPVYNPLHPEGVEEYGQKMLTLLRKPFPVQAEVIKGISKALYGRGRRHLFVCGEMGTGKTLVSLATAGNAPTMRVLVVCPTHLVEKWIREAQSSIPDVHTVDLTVKNVISVLHAFRHEKGFPKTQEIHVISKEKAKLSYAWRPAALKTKRSIFPHCPAVRPDRHERRRVCDLRRACKEEGLLPVVQQPSLAGGQDAQKVRPGRVHQEVSQGLLRHGHHRRDTGLQGRRHLTGQGHGRSFEQLAVCPLPHGHVELGLC